MLKKLMDVVFWVGVSLYFGGLMTLGIVAAPGIFQGAAKAQVAMPGIVSPPLEMSRQVGGELFGEVLTRFGVIEGISLGLMLVGIGGWVLGHRKVRRSTWVVAALWVLVAALALTDIAWLRPKVWTQRATVREQAAAHASEGMNATWPERAEFDKLHQWSEALGRAKGYTLLAMILVTAWRGLADKGVRERDPEN